MTLKQRLTEKQILVAPGVCDALTASLAAKSGFEALYVSGAAIAYTRLGQPDIGLAKEKLDWEPKVMLSDGLDRTIAYYRELMARFGHHRPSSCIS